MINMAKTLRREDQRAFDTWFNRWIKNTRLEQSLIEAARKGYKSLIVYDRKNDMDVYQKRRFEDPRFVKRLQSELPDLHVELRQYLDKNAFGLSFNAYKVAVSWEVLK